MSPTAAARRHSAPTTKPCWASSATTLASSSKRPGIDAAPYRPRRRAMIVGTVREIKNEEYRVGLTPEGVHALVDDGHTVLVESGAGAGVLFGDDAYAASGGQIVARADDVWARADLMVKVKEPLFPEFPLLREKQS